MVLLQILKSKTTKITKYLLLKHKVQILIWNDLSKKGKIIGGIIFIFLYKNNNIYITFLYIIFLYQIQQKMKKSGVKRYKNRFNNFVVIKIISLLCFCCIREEFNTDLIKIAKLECKPNIILQFHIYLTKNIQFNTLNLFNNIYNDYILSIYRIEILLILSIIIMQLTLNSFKVASTIMQYQAYNVSKWQKQKKFFFILTFSSQTFAIITSEINKFRISLQIRNKKIFSSKLQQNLEIINLLHVFYIRKKKSIKKNIIGSMYLDNSLSLNFFYTGIKPIYFLQKSNYSFIIIGLMLFMLLSII